MREDSETHTEFYLADQLGVPVTVIRRLPLSDFYGHLEYYQMKEEQAEKDRKKQARQMRSKSSKG